MAIFIIFLLNKVYNRALYTLPLCSIIAHTSLLK